MKPNFTDQGIQVQTFEEIFAELVAGYQAIYGDIDFSQNTKDGQVVGIEANLLLDLQSFGAYVATQLDPDFATGFMLRVIAKLCGISPRPATYSQWDLTVNSTRDLTLSDGYTVEDEIGQQWKLTVDTTINIGANVVTFRAVDSGAIIGTLGDTITPVDVVLGISSIVADIDNSTVGVAEETDEEFRIRRNKSLENPSYSIVGGLYAKLGNLSNVTDVVVYENDKDTTDAPKEMPPHSIWVIIEGGNVSEIVEIMAKQKTGGTVLKGSVTSTYQETIILNSTTSFIYNHEMKFDRPTYVPVYIKATATRKVSTDPVDLALIKTKLATFSSKIGTSFQAGELYEYGLLAGTNFVLTDLLVSKDNITFTDGKLTPDYDEKFTFNTANIIITEVI